MKKKLLLVFMSCTLLFTFVGCSSTDTKTDVSASEEAEDALSGKLRKSYDFYDDSIEEIKKNMELDTEKANAVFETLIEIGLDDKITYCFSEDEYFKVWWGLKKVNVYLSGGVVEKILEGDTQIYPPSNKKDTTDNSTVAKSNTSAKVDEIILQAKNDAENISENDLNAKWNEAFKYLKDHQNNFYESNEVMENAMYYGAFIYEYIELNAVASNTSELQDSTKAAYEAGLNTVDAIKYVYRGTESETDQTTQNKLSEAIKNLDLISVE